MMVFKKKEIIAASLVVLIGVAGYLNWSYQDTVHVTDGESYIETGKKLGEAQYVSSVEEVEETASTEDISVEEDNGARDIETAESPEPAEETAAQDIAEQTASQGANYFEQAKLDKEKSRAKSLEILNQTAANESFDSEIRAKAGEKILNTASNVEKESEIESLAQSKGYSEICVFVDGEEASIIVRKEGFSPEDVAKLTEIATEQLKISANNIKVVEVK